MPDLKLLFRQSGKRQRDVADAVGRSEAAVSQWVNGERDIPAELIPRVEVTGIPRHRLRPDLWGTTMNFVSDAARQAPELTHLQVLEAESIHILREVVAEAENPVMLYSVGKDSSVMLHLALKAFAPGVPPFPLLHVNTTWKFREMIEFRDRVVREHGLTLLEWINKDGIARGVTPFSTPAYTDIMKTEALKAALDHYGFDAAFGGARRDEEKSRAKERIFSFRSAQHRWDPGTLASIQRAQEQGREHPRLSTVQLDRAGYLAIHPSGEDPDRAAVFLGRT
jgi:3'-phosphoadenosine 5'-phosphosulfate sulfotransferase (PAPS reductase)/FAD synthetase